MGEYLEQEKETGFDEYLANVSFTILFILSSSASAAIHIYIKVVWIPTKDDAFANIISRPQSRRLLPSDLYRMTLASNSLSEAGPIR